MVKILHAADFHLDSPFKSLPADAAILRRGEQRAIIERVADIAEENNVDLILLAGDLFDSGRAYYETSEFLWRVFSRMKARIFIAPGNHDPYNGCSPYAVIKLPDNVHVFKALFPEKVEIPELGVNVWGAAFIDNEAPPLMRGFVCPEDGINIGVFHGDVTNAESRYSAIGEQDIANSKLDYLALGHVHTYSGIKYAGTTCYAYSGTPEGRGFDETGEKGIIIGSIDKKNCKLEFMPLGGRKYEIRHVKVDNIDDFEAELSEDTRRDIYRIIIEGETDTPPDIKRVKERLEPKFYHVEVRDATNLKRDIWSDSGGNSLRGIFLQRMRKRYEQADTDEKRERIVLAVRYALAAMENREEVQR